MVGENHSPEILEWYVEEFGVIGNDDALLTDENWSLAECSFYQYVIVYWQSK